MSVQLGRRLHALAVMRGLKSDIQTATAVSAAGFEVSQQSVNNYRNGTKMPPVGFIVAFVRGIDLDPDERRDLLRAYVHERPDLEEFVWMWRNA